MSSLSNARNWGVYRSQKGRVLGGLRAGGVQENVSRGPALVEEAESILDCIAFNARNGLVRDYAVTDSSGSNLVVGSLLGVDKLPALLSESLDALERVDWAVHFEVAPLRAARAVVEGLQARSRQMPFIAVVADGPVAVGRVFDDDAARAEHPHVPEAVADIALHKSVAAAVGKVAVATVVAKVGHGE